MEQATNQFQKGLQLDTNPMVQGNDTLTDCLNGTIVTMNGNEVILQNDMGNRRVDMAFLQSGYQPVGIKEYGGVIYVASYNPITNKSQLGSFPSPQRLIGDTDDLTSNPTIEFLSTPGDYGLHYLKVDSKLFPLTGEVSLHAGDKFVIYGSLFIQTKIEGEGKVLELNCNCQDLDVGQTCTYLRPVFITDSGEQLEAQTLSWSSSNPTIAQVNQNGVVTAISEGTATIQVIADEYYTASCTISVHNAQVCYDYKVDITANDISGSDEIIQYQVKVYKAIAGTQDWQEYTNYSGNLDIIGNTNVGPNTTGSPRTFTLTAKYTEDNGCGEEKTVQDSVTVTQSSQEDCITYSISITAEDVSASATSPNYTVTASHPYTVSGDTHFDANDTTENRQKTLIATINNPSQNQCSGSNTTAQVTFNQRGKVIPSFTSKVQINIRTAENTSGFCRDSFLNGFVDCPGGDYIQIAGNIEESGSIIPNAYWAENFTPTFILQDFGTGVQAEGGGTEFEGYIPRLIFPNGAILQITPYRVGNASESC